MSQHIPQPPTATYRGDRFRLNFTAGLILAKMADAEDGSLSVAVLAADLKDQNELAGIPGGAAGSQWSPPPTKGKRKPKIPVTGDNPDVPDLDVPEDDEPVETFPDTLREHCTYFDQAPDRLSAILRMLDYCALVTYDGGADATITQLGRDVLALLDPAEDLEKARAGTTGSLTPAQQYLVGDPRDTSTTYSLPFPARPFNIGEAVRTAFEIHHEHEDPAPIFAKLPAAAYASAAATAARFPGMTVDVNTGEAQLDAELPVRRNLYRRPSYRQFLWIALNERNTFALAYAGVDADTVRIIASHASTGTAAEVKADPLLMRVKEARTVARKIRTVAEVVLAGGPEGVWVAKPLEPKDVHADIMSFIAAGRAGFEPKVALASSLAWEVYQNSALTIRDYEAARAALHALPGTSAADAAALPDLNIDAEAVGAEAVADSATRADTLKSAAAFVNHASDALLVEAGVDLDVRYVATTAGVPMDIRCRHVNIHINRDTGKRSEQPCSSKSIGGSGYCERHGGTYLSPEETESLVRAAQQKLFAAGNKAVEVMIQLMLNSTNDAIRLRAAEQILNRGGLSESRDININVSDDSDSSRKTAGQMVRENLVRLTGIEPGAQKEIEKAQRDGVMSEYGEVIDAEIEEAESA